MSETADPNDVVDSTNDITLVQQAFDDLLDDLHTEDDDWYHEQLNGGDIRISGTTVEHADELARSVVNELEAGRFETVTYDVKTFGNGDPNHVTMVELNNIRHRDPSSDEVSTDQLAALELAQYLDDEFGDEVYADADKGMVEGDAPHRELFVHHLTQQGVYDVLAFIREFAVANSAEAGAELRMDVEVLDYHDDHHGETPGQQVHVSDVRYHYE